MREIPANPTFWCGVNKLLNLPWLDNLGNRGFGVEPKMTVTLDGSMDDSVKAVG